MNRKQIVVSSPDLGLSGATTFIARLLNRLQRDGWDAEWLVTGHVVKNDGQWLKEPSWPVQRFEETKVGQIQKRQAMLIERLQKTSPCVYLPTFDFDMLHAVPALPPEVAVAMVVHSDEPVYYEATLRMERHLNAIVGVSDCIVRKLRQTLKNSFRRIHKIHYGIEPVTALDFGGRPASRLMEIIYCGRLSFYQKRIQDLAEVIRRCHSQHIPARFSIAGTGPDEIEFFESIARPLASGYVRRLGLLSNEETLRVLSESDIVIMTSDFEGLPVILLEAMSQGCVPVVTRTESGMAELVRHMENGYLLPIGDVAAFVETLKILSAERSHLQQLKKAAFEGIHGGGFTLKRAAKEYTMLFESLMLGEEKSAMARNGRAIIPCQYRFKSRLRKALHSLLWR